MAGDLKTQEYTTPGGYKATMRVNPDHAKAYQESSKRNEERAKRRRESGGKQAAPPAETKERKPAARSGDVRTKT
jgi:hypothetical protein